MHGATTREWPQFPFCSQRCKLIDLGRWLGQKYTIPAEKTGQEPDPGDDEASLP
jgi:endogenous inhibitor of DNA gyrase (YacG/DUF329 family)